MKVIIDTELIKDLLEFEWGYEGIRDDLDRLFRENGTPIPDNATNGDVIKAMFGADKVFGFIHYVHLMARVGNWFNEGVVAEFDRDWWNALYQKGGKE